MFMKIFLEKIDGFGTMCKIDEAHRVPPAIKLVVALYKSFANQQNL